MIATLKKIYGYYVHNKLFRRQFSYQNKLRKKYQNIEDCGRLEYVIKVRTHGIEKGLSFRKPKEAFGVSKILILIDCVKKYMQYPNFNKDSVNETLNVLNTYITKFKTNPKIEPVVKEYNTLIADFGAIKECCVGTMTINKKDVEEAIDIDYLKFIKSRHSYRYFAKDASIKQIKQALEIARYTPTACNRQPQCVHIYHGKEMEEVLTIQHGALGFIDEMSYCILVTADIRAYSYHENNQVYVDGGLYAMNLLNALHSTGLGTIPLTCGHLQGTKRTELARFGVKEYECPIIVIGIGGLEETAEVNVSPRKEYTDYTTFHTK